jgi:hypothetical protein
MTALHAGALVATFHRAAPSRCGGFADERRVVVSDEVDRVRHRRARASLVASFAADVTV